MPERVLVVLVVLLLIALLFGLGTALEVTLWALLVVAAIVVVAGLLVGAALRRS